jgi:hypothetical protein
MAALTEPERNTFLLDEVDMAIVATADPLRGPHGDGLWRLEKANLNLVGKFINSLPSE